MVRQGPAARRDRRTDLQLRMHLLRRLRRAASGECLPELRWRVRAAADPAGNRVAPWPFRVAAAAPVPDGGDVLRSGGSATILRPPARHRAGAALSAT